MSQIIFNSTVDMQNILGTPSSGFAVAYDVDNVIKQKDSSGIVTPIGGGGGGSQSLRDVLKIGNDSVTYSITLGTSSFIRSGAGNGILYLGYGNTSSIYMRVGNNSGTSSITNQPDFISIENIYGSQFNRVYLSVSTSSINSGSSTYSTSIINDRNSFRVRVNESLIGYNDVINVRNITDLNDGVVKSSLHLNTYGSTTSFGLKNSVIVGGENLLATESNTVYLGNTVNINNKYKLPSVDGTSAQVMVTDGAGNLTWTDVSDGSVPPLHKVLEAGATSGSYSIVLGASQSIKALNGNAGIYLDYGDVSNTVFITNNISYFGTYSYILMTDDNLIISATNGLVTTTNGLGLQYTSDYTPTFVTNSLVTKGYVDSIGSGTYFSFKTAFVDPTYGSNTTALINRIDLPYATYASASQILSTTYPAGGGKIYFKKGLYTEACELISNTDYYCEPGVIFTENGFNDGGGAVTVCNIYGSAKFIGTDATLVALDVQNSSNINFEFDEIDNLQVGFKLNSGGNVNVNGRYIKSQADYGSVISIEGSGNFNFNISDGVIGAYDVIYLKSSFTGTFSLTSKEVICDSALNVNGAQVDVDNALKVHNSSTGNATINSNLYNKSAYAGGENAAVRIGGGNITINGDLNGNNEVGLNLIDGVAGNVIVNGDIRSKRESIKHQSNLIKLKVNNSFIYSEGLGSTTYSVHINGASQSGTYIFNSTIYNGLTNSGIVYMQGTTSQVGIYNSLGYSTGTIGNFIYGTPSFNVGIHNTRSNKDNYIAVNDLFSPSGFIYDSDLYIPKF